MQEVNSPLELNGQAGRCGEQIRLGRDERHVSAGYWCARRHGAGNGRGPGNRCVHSGTGGESRFSKQLRCEAHPAEKRTKTWIRAQGIESRIDFYEGHPSCRPLLVCLLQPAESLLLIPQIGINFGQAVPASGIGAEFRKGQFFSPNSPAVRSWSAPFAKRPATLRSDRQGNRRFPGCRDGLVSQTFHPVCIRVHPWPQ